jgi:pyruvate dehydrogenase E2 component (dihydrolipoamide acetyltransferase)
MARRILEINLESKGRLGFYNAVPPNDIDAMVVEWYVKEGDTIGFTQDPNTGKKIGRPLLKIESEKGGVEITAEGWEIGARITKILIPPQKDFSYNLNKNPLHLAELETGEPEKVGKPADTSMPDNSDKPLKTDLRITPLAQRAAEELGVDLEKVRAWLKPDATELTLEDVQEFAMTHETIDPAKPVSGEKPPIKAAPKTRQHAKELGVDLSRLLPTGPSGIVRMADIDNFVKQRDEEKSERVPETSAFIPPTDFREFEVMKPTMRRKTTARHMVKAWQAPHASPSIDINPAPLLDLRGKMKESFEKLHGAKLRIDHFFVAACAYLLSQKEFRILNAYWHEEDGKQEMRLYKHVNVGIAAAIAPDKTRSGFSELVVPVIKEAETLSFIEIVKEAERLIADAIKGDPKSDDLMGLTFIVNNTGSPVEWRGIKMSGDEYPDPIFAAETAALVAFGATREEGGAKKMRIILRFDHRLVDGYEPKLFLRALQYLLENPEQILTIK